MSKADNAKNANMAKRMKEQGITRVQTRCPINAKHLVSIKSLPNHLLNCKGFKRDN